MNPLWSDWAGFIVILYHWQLNAYQNVKYDSLLNAIVGVKYQIQRGTVNGLAVNLAEGGVINTTEIICCSVSFSLRISHGES